MNIREVTKRLGVSASTVSRALNPATRHKISEKTRRRIEAFVQKHGYVPNRAARHLVSGRTNTVGVILPTVFESAFFNDHLVKVLAGVHRVFSRRTDYECKLIILPAGEPISQLQRQSLLSGVDGLLISSYCDHSLYSASFFPKNLVKELNRQTVVLNQRGKSHAYLSSVSFSNAGAAYKAVTYLIRKGHQRIAFVNGSAELPDSAERLAGYRAALSDHHLPADRDLIAVGNYLPASGYEAAVRFLNMKPAPTALFCANDEMALGALDAIRALRLRCPQDVAVMGFDGIDVGNYTFPRLTSVRQPTVEIADAGANLLLDLIEKKVKGPVDREVETEVVVRDSA